MLTENAKPELNKLIEKAASIVGSEAKLAKALGLPQPNISGWKSGQRTCTPEDRARLAGFAKEDAVQELVRATLEKTEGTLRGEQLRQVLGKWLARTGGVLHSVTVGLVSLTYGLTMFDIPRCIKSRLCNRRYTFR